MTRRPLLIGNASGFYGDRFDALREMLTDGPLDVLTGDYLAELTMLILGRDRLKNPELGYAKTFLRQLEECLGLAHERGVRIVVNAGGLNPAGLAGAVRALAAKLSVPVAVAHVEGDDLMPYPLPSGESALTANAYLGGAGITACLRAGADVVVTGRVTDAALVSGPAAWWFDWAPDDHDRLAGAVVAGHVLECGTQATGGNYAFFTRHDVSRPGFPLAEIAEDGSSVITKHRGTGGIVSVGTVTAQLLYETQGTRYLGPDVTARLDTVRLSEAGADRVRISGVLGEAPPGTLKVGVTRIGGWRNEVVFVLTGLDIDAKAALVREQLAELLAPVSSVSWTLSRTDHADAETEETASALLRLVVRDPSPDRVGRALTSAAIELALASYPGFHVTAPPSPAQPYGVFTATALPSAQAPHTAVLADGTRIAMPASPAPNPAPPAFEERGSGGGAPEGAGAQPPVSGRGGAGESPAGPTAPGSQALTAPGSQALTAPGSQALTAPGSQALTAPGSQALTAPGSQALTAPGSQALTAPGSQALTAPGSQALTAPEPQAPTAPEPQAPTVPTRRVPLGTLFGARSGDKGGDANVGVWAETGPAWEWLRTTLTVEAFKALLPEAAPLEVARAELPNLRSLNFTVTRILGDGVASGHRFDPQAKGLGEWLRSRHVDIPEALLQRPAGAPAAVPPRPVVAPAAVPQRPAEAPAAVPQRPVVAPAAVPPQPPAGPPAALPQPPAEPPAEPPVTTTPEGTP
ncbi:acyclic terpene utilization AtuA family protein [Streptomyces sp. NBC_01298]|uniref:acyclic terpene utilization AtuA family protein n=1 Tax=Streptomyces sp. NBC_01298 TaxID=2903817 RepID=UPI002E15DC19|nr:acyclic terpene utilization AtuA family protein [Streptomyces sp. NBC_01298]